MDRIRRNERLAVMTRILVANPNKIFTLGTFCQMLGSAKSTLSEDIDILQGVFMDFRLGKLETVTGAAGGVRYRPICRTWWRRWGPLWRRSITVSNRISC